MATEFSCKFLLYLGSVAKDNDKLLHNQAQLGMGIVHFFSISMSEKYTSFSWHRPKGMKVLILCIF